MSRLSWLLAATTLVVAGCTDDSTHSDPDPVVGPVITPVSTDTKVRVSPTSGLGVTERGGSATFTVELTRQPTHDVTIHLYVDDESEGRIDASTLVFTTTSFGPRTVTVTGVDDGEDDGNQGFDVVLGEAISRDLRYQSVEASDVHVTNVDDDAPGVTVLAADGLSTTEAGGTATFTVQLNTRPTGEVVIPVTSESYGEVAVSVNELRFYPRDWDVPQTVTVTGVDDYLDDGDVAANVAIGRVASTDLDYVGLDPADVVVTNVDDENPGVSLPTENLTMVEGSYLYAYPFQLTSRPTSYVYVYARSADGTFYGSAYFDYYNWNYPQTMYIYGDNFTVDGDRDVVLDITTESYDPAYNARDFGDLTIRVIDNDVPSLALYTSGGTTEGYGCTYAEVYLGAMPSADVTVRLTSSDEGQLTVTTPLLTFYANGSTYASTTICPVDDAVIDGDRYVTVTAAIETSADPAFEDLPPSSSSVYVGDNDVALNVVNLYGTYYTYPGYNALFQVNLGAAPSHDVVIPVATTNASQGVTAVSELVFTPDNWSVPQPLEVIAVDDGVYDSWGVSYQLVIGPAVSDDPVFAGQASTQYLYGYY
jgi:hypothetical protein